MELFLLLLFLIPGIFVLVGLLELALNVQEWYYRWDQKWKYNEMLAKKHLKEIQSKHR